MDGLTILGMILLVAGFVLVGIEMVVPGFSVPGISPRTAQQAAPKALAFAVCMRSMALI